MTETMQASETEVLLSKINSLFDLCPAKGPNKASDAQRQFWILGFSEGSAASLTVAINRMRNPAAPEYDEVKIIDKIIHPLLQSRDVEEAERAAQALIHQSWTHS